MRAFSILLICLLLVGCGKPSNASNDSVKPADNATETTDNSAGKTKDSSTGAPIAQSDKPRNLSESYTAYITVKGDFSSRLSDGLSEAQSAAGLDLLGISLIDLYLVPILAMGVDETYAQSALSYFDFTGIKYTADGNHYTLNFTDAGGIPTVIETTYDSAKDAASSEVKQSGEKAVILEYTKTSYGYATQYFIKNGDGTYAIYKGTFYNEKDGIIGLTNNAAAQPASIVGGAEVSKDFPKDCSSWYEINGTAGTGKDYDGTTFEFTVPGGASN